MCHKKMYLLIVTFNTFSVAVCYMNSATLHCCTVPNDAFKAGQNHQFNKVFYSFAVFSNIMAIFR